MLCNHSKVKILQVEFPKQLVRVRCDKCNYVCWESYGQNY